MFRKQIKSIIDKYVGKENKEYLSTVIYLNNKNIHMPLWTFKMLFEIFEFCVQEKKLINFDNILSCDMLALGYADYDRQLLEYIMRLMGEKSGNN